MMRTGDKWQLTVPGSLGFGEKGRSASPGKPRIPGNAELDFILELVGVRRARLELPLVPRPSLGSGPTLASSPLAQVPGKDEEIIGDQ